MQKQKVHDMISYTFLKSTDHGEFKHTKCLQNFEKLNLYLRKTEDVQILPKDICAKIVQYALFCKRLFKEL